MGWVEGEVGVGRRRRWVRTLWVGIDVVDGWDFLNGKVKVESAYVGMELSFGAFNAR